jgi:predicted DNA-binding transcriptional regulator AlpA
VEAEFLDYAGVSQLLGASKSGKPIHRTTLKRWVRAGVLPRPTRLGSKIVRFRRSEVLAALEKRKGRVR